MPNQTKASEVLLGIVLLGIASAPVYIIYQLDQRSDELAQAGGRNRLYDWLAKGDLLDKGRDNEAPFTQCAPLDHRQGSAHFVVWVFGDDYLAYSDVKVGSGALGGEADTWGHANSVLLVKLTDAGYETHQVAVISQYAKPETGDYTDEKVKVYNAEAWLVDRKRDNVSRTRHSHLVQPPRVTTA